MTRDDLKQNFEHFDRDRNGSIDLEEFSLLLVALDAGMNAEEVREGFARVDVDQNGVIDFEEFCAWWSD